MKPLIVYYSFSGNTEEIAKRIKEKTGGALLKIDTVSPYVGDYNAVVEQGKREVEKKYLPPITVPDVALSDYDTVVIGTPVWWYTMAPAVKTFLSENRFDGKKVYPFATNGGWVGHTFEDIQKDMPGAKVYKGLDIYYSGSRLRTDGGKIDEWIKKIEF